MSLNGWARVEKAHILGDKVDRNCFAGTKFKAAFCQFNVFGDRSYAICCVGGLDFGSGSDRPFETSSGLASVIGCDSGLCTGLASVNAPS